MTGPNPQLPILLDFFFPASALLQFVVAVVIGASVIGIRLFPYGGRWIRSRYLKASCISSAYFAPSSGFADTSLVLMSLVAIFSAGAMLAFLEMTLPRKAVAA